MPDIASVLKQEITRLAKKEVRTSISPVKKQTLEFRKAIASLKSQLARIERTMAKLVADASKRMVIPTAAEQDESNVRISPASVKRQRSRLKLSQKEMGQLLGVSTATIVGWESGRTRPRGANKEGFAELRSLGIKAVRARLAKGGN